MKITREGNGYIDQHGTPVTWQDISFLTGLDRSESRLLLKKLAAHGEVVPAERLMDWRNKEQLAFRLEAHMSLHL